MQSVGTPAFWIGFAVVVLGMLALDLGIFNRKAHVIHVKEALTWTVVWVALSIAFGLGIGWFIGPDKGLEFFTGYLIEEALSVDNIFVMLVVFSYFSVPASLQHRVLFWGILGALLMRAMFIFAGAALLQRFHWVMYLFGAILVFTGGKLLFQDEEAHPERNPVLKLFRKLFRSVPDYRGQHFLVKESGRWLATPLLFVLVTIEATDLVFAVDSIPAVFGISRDPFIVFTSNIFAVLGLRSMFFLLSGIVGKFRFLKVGLALVLLFVGGKMLIADWVHIPIWVSLGTVALLIAGSVAASLLVPPAPESKHP